MMIGSDNEADYQADAGPYRKSVELHYSAQEGWGVVVFNPERRGQEVVPLFRYLSGLHVAHKWEHRPLFPGLVIITKVEFDRLRSGVPVKGRKNIKVGRARKRRE